MIWHTAIRTPPAQMSCSPTTDESPWIDYISHATSCATSPAGTIDDGIVGVTSNPTYVKIPGTEAGLTAIEDTIAAGIPVNATPLFSLQRHRQAAEAYIRGPRRLLDDGGDLNTVASDMTGNLDWMTEARMKDQMMAQPKLKRNR